MKQCCAKNKIRKSPESAIATFLATDDFNKPDCAMIKFYTSLSCKITPKTQKLQPFRTIYNDFKVFEVFMTIFKIVLQIVRKLITHQIKSLNIFNNFLKNQYVFVAS